MIRSLNNQAELIFREIAVSQDDSCPPWQLRNQNAVYGERRDRGGRTGDFQFVMLADCDKAAFMGFSRRS